MRHNTEYILIYTQHSIGDLFICLVRCVCVRVSAMCVSHTIFDNDLF